MEANGVMEMDKLNFQIYQAQFHSSDECSAAIAEMEHRFKYTDEIDYFANLVNFSTAKKAPFLIRFLKKQIRRINNGFFRFYI